MLYLVGLAVIVAFVLAFWRLFGAGNSRRARGNDPLELRLAGSREAQETSPYRLHAKAAGRAQQPGKNWEGLESYRRSLLTHKTLLFAEQ